MALDDADKAYIANLLKDVLTGEELKKTIGDAAKAHIDAAFKDQDGKLDEKIKSATKDFKPADGGKAGEEKPSGKDPKVDDATAQELAQLKARVEASEKGRREAEAKSQREALHNQTHAALVKAGIPADKVPLVLPYLETQGLLSAKNGKLGWNGKDQYGIDTVLPLEEGAAAWAKTDAGKHFLPPSNAQGTGGGGGQRLGAGNSGTVKLSDLSLSSVLNNINK